MPQLPTPVTRDRTLRSEIGRIVGTMGVFLALLWGIEIVDANIMNGSLDGLGIMPRTTSGLLGILAAPFLHGGWGHLISNTIGIMILGGLTMAIGRREFIVVSLAGLLVGGLGTWALGRPAMHIGASGLVFAYLGYLVLRGWYDRRLGSVLLAGAVAWFYGSMIFGMIPGFAPPVISWECHLFGFVGGVLAARLLHKRG